MVLIAINVVTFKVLLIVYILLSDERRAVSINFILC